MAGEGYVRLKLLIDSKGQRVLFAEAEKNVVDFLFHLLSLPLGTVCKLLKKQSMVGCLENLYQSVETLNQTYFQPNLNKDSLLKPKVVSFCSSTMLLPCTDPPALPKFYTCSKSTNSYMYDDDYHNNRGNCGNSYSDDPTAVCPTCKHLMSRESAYVNPPSKSTKPISTEEDEGGYVKGVVTYMVMDDLTVKPMSTISSITLLNKFNIKDVGALEEKLINLDINQGVKLLRASLQSKTVLTDVFLGMKKL